MSDPSTIDHELRRQRFKRLLGSKSDENLPNESARPKPRALQQANELIGMVAGVDISITEQDSPRGSTDDINEWECARCTLTNSSVALLCRACGYERPSSGWKCHACTAINQNLTALQCEVCSTIRARSDSEEKLNAELLNLPFMKRGSTGTKPDAEQLAAIARAKNNPLLNNFKSSTTIGSTGMSWVTRRVQAHRALTDTQDEKRKLKHYSYQASSNVWLAKRINHAQVMDQWQRWELEQQDRPYTSGRFTYLSQYRGHDYSTDVGKLNAAQLTDSGAVDDGLVRMDSNVNWAAAKESRIPYIPPTLRGGTQTLTLQQVLDDREFRGALRTFLEENYCQENLDFIEAVEEYKQQPILHIAKSIIDRFISQGARDQVNLDSATRKQTIEAYKTCKENPKGEGTKTVLDAAYRIVFNMVEKDVFTRFTGSHEYLEMLVNYLESQLLSGHIMDIMKGSGWKNTGQFKSIQIDLIRASDLPKHPDPYCVLTMNGKSFKSRTINNSPNPEWNEHFEFPLLASTQYFEANLWDFTSFTSDDFLGGVLIPIESLPTEEQGGEIEYVLLARETHQRISGSLTLHVRLSTQEASVDESHHIMSENKGASISDVVRQKVSKKKVRYQQDGYDLDLTYINDRIIAMGFPSEKLERLFRNRMKDVIRFLNSKHPNCFKVYNLCSEREYSPAKFNYMCAHFPFDDHNPPPFLMIPRFCENVITWLNEHPQNVAAVHCKAGKGRTGCMLGCLLLATQEKGCSNAQAALDYFAEKRTMNKQGVTIPSQQRYVHYAQKYYELYREYVYEHRPEENKLSVLRGIGQEKTERMRVSPSAILPPKMFFLKGIMLDRIPKAIESFNVDVWFTVSCASLDHVFSSKKRVAIRRDVDRNRMLFLCSDQIPIVEDVKVEFFHSTRFGKGELMFKCWFNTRFILKETLSLSKMELDKAVKDKDHKLYDKNMKLQIMFEPAGLDVKQEPAETEFSEADEPRKRFGKKKKRDKLEGYLRPRATDSPVPMEGPMLLQDPNQQLLQVARASNALPRRGHRKTVSGNVQMEQNRGLVKQLAANYIRPIGRK